MRSLVNKLEKPTLWSEGEGRWMGAGITEVASINSRGSRVGMFSQIYCPVRETRLRRWGDPRPLRVRKRKRSGCRRESEGFIVPLEIEGRDPALFAQPKRGGSRDCHVANHPGYDQDAPE